MLRLGYFVTESSEHFAEYTPYFINAKHPELIGKYEIPLDEYAKRKASGGQSAAEWGEALLCEKSVEYAARIIAACALGKAIKFRAMWPIVA